MKLRIDMLTKIRIPPIRETTHKPIQRAQKR
jgi:hypothetical protein